MIGWITAHGFWWIPKLVIGIVTWIVTLSAGAWILLWASRVARFIYYKVRNIVRKAREIK